MVRSSCGDRKRAAHCPAADGCKNCNCGGGNNKPGGNGYSQVQHYNQITMSCSDSSTRRENLMRTITPTRLTPVKTTIIQIALLLAAFGTSGTMFAATLA